MPLYHVFEKYCLLFILIIFFATQIEAYEFECDSFIHKYSPTTLSFVVKGKSLSCFKKINFDETTHLILDIQEPILGVLAKFSQMLRTSQKIEKLSLNCQKYRDCLEPLLDGLIYNQSITHLNLRNANWHSFLKENKTLKTLFYADKTDDVGTFIGIVDDTEMNHVALYLEMNDGDNRVNEFNLYYTFKKDHVHFLHSQVDLIRERLPISLDDFLVLNKNDYKEIDAYAKKPFNGSLLSIFQETLDVSHKMEVKNVIDDWVADNGNSGNSGNSGNNGKELMLVDDLGREILYQHQGKNRILVPDIHGDLNILLMNLLKSGLVRFKADAPSYMCLNNDGYEVHNVLECRGSNLLMIPNLEVAKDACEKNKKITFLGDVIDRGYFSVELLMTLVRILDDENNSCASNDHPIQMVIGNHELMLLNYDYFSALEMINNPAASYYSSFVSFPGYSFLTQAVYFMRKLIMKEKIVASLWEDDILFTHSYPIVERGESAKSFSRAMNLRLKYLAVTKIGAIKNIEEVVRAVWQEIAPEREDRQVEEMYSFLSIYAHTHAFESLNPHSLGIDFDQSFFYRKFNRINGAVYTTLKIGTPIFIELVPGKEIQFSIFKKDEDRLEEIINPEAPF